ncbi:hypothetical protein GUJ93_ZPchr0005g15476 [Zizania palustris]|uniref:Signal recognition particle SRP54 helical bundle domain-containing protein n=1 Tax=Zizania palustris TaxID=103762 RepID=A0A8J5VIL5_ZIZPA|nr:hypothetical protein GUJ93_ZPchr0005g15476 [Zizania palustris]
MCCEAMARPEKTSPVIDELLTYWNLVDTDRVLDDLEEVLLVLDSGPKISFRIVETLREQIRNGKLKSDTEIKEALKSCILELLTSKGVNSKLQLGFRLIPLSHEFHINASVGCGMTGA